VRDCASAILGVSVRPRRSRSRAAEEGFPPLLRTLLALGVPCLLLAAGPDGAQSLTEQSAARCRPVSEHARLERFNGDLSYQYAPPEDRALVSAIGDFSDASSFSHALDCAAAWTRLGSLRSVSEPVELPHLPLLRQPGDWWADAEPLREEEVFHQPKPAHIEAYIQVYAAERSAMVMLFRGESVAALQRLDAVSGLDADTMYPSSSQSMLLSVKIAALRAFILGGGTLGCGVPIVPREPRRPAESQSEPAERVVVPDRSHAKEGRRGEISPAGEAFVAAVTGAYASYTEACAAGWREYDRALVECSIDTIVIADGGALDALSAARDAEAALRPRDRKNPEVLWSSAVLPAASHDTPRAHVLLQQLASGRWGVSVADNASALDAWLTVAGGLDCNLPFVANGAARSAPAE